MHRMCLGWSIVGALLVCGCRMLSGHNVATFAPIETDGQLVIHCDFELPQQHRLIREVQAERDDVYRLLDLPPSDEPIHVHLFRDEPTYREFVARRFPTVPERRAFFLETDTRLAVFAVWTDRVSDDLRHEVAHGYLHSAVPNLPLWLDEGLAEYFEVPRGRRGLNVPHVELLLSKIEAGWQPDLEQLEKLTSASQMEQHHYAEAWAWVHLLLETDPDRRELLRDHLRQLRDQGTAEPLSAELESMFDEPESVLREYLLALAQEI